MRIKRYFFFLFLCVIITLQGCTSENIKPPEVPRPYDDIIVEKEDTQKKTECYIYTAMPEGKEIYEGNGTKIDASEKANGCIMVSQEETQGRVKLQIILNDMTYSYDIKADGNFYDFPLQMGSGTYTVRTLENIGGAAYSVIYSADIEVMISNELMPYLYSSSIVDYGENDLAVKKAMELCYVGEKDNDKINSVFEYIKDNIKYDYEKADNVENGYISDTDETIKEKKGICIDYSVLMAVMLRSQNIPTKVIYGSAKEASWHSWNMVYCDGEWKLYDATFAAGGAVGEDYMESYSY